ncbi:uncharacterized protein VTP21DRAFT_1481 [Calcarisporiella thermophila]|uniref:uncharacterized protein n=1 Tax=Calcarisporiella thermophila TaxID=911321 RepID=UPI00374383EB
MNVFKKIKDKVEQKVKKSDKNEDASQDDSISPALLSSSTEGPSGKEILAQNLPDATEEKPLERVQGDEYGLVTPLPEPNVINGRSWICGPLLRYENVLNNVWRGSVLMVEKTEESDVPVLEWWFEGGREQEKGRVTGEAIDNYEGHVFWRFGLEIPLDQDDQCVGYSICGGPKNTWFLPGINQKYRWMFFSCNGYSQSVQDQSLWGGHDPLWNDFFKKHSEQPYHLMVGGGDQIYCDSILKEPVMIEEWLEKGDRKVRRNTAMSERLYRGMQAYYFRHYCRHFAQGLYAHALAQIPSVNMWDDHDIIDGFGSYPESLQMSEIMQRIGKVAERFYLLFQHHTTEDLAPQHGFYSTGRGHHLLTSLGPQVLLLGLDARAERTKISVCSPSTYDATFIKLYEETPPDTQHLFVLIGVPIVYPRLNFAENMMESAKALKNLSILTGQRTGVFESVVNKLNADPELLDDLSDHWTAGPHKEERKGFIEKLQLYAREKNVRVTFISGDVHCASVGKLHSKATVEEQQDPNTMYQIISSAIVNIPPPDGLIQVLHMRAKTYTLNDFTVEDSVDLFELDVDEVRHKKTKLYNRRNYATFNQGDDGAFIVNICIERDRDKGYRDTKPYTVVVPRLMA